MRKLRNHETRPFPVARFFSGIVWITAIVFFLWSGELK